MDLKETMIVIGGILLFFGMLFFTNSITNRVCALLAYGVMVWMIITNIQI